ncbi:MAG: serine/threonine protein kinase [Planctomycetes bacterium]|nr:serine/threonine protein kinase [Planctomycetota bacterium]
MPLATFPSRSDASSSSGRKRRGPSRAFGPTIPGYRIERELGRGSYGVVFLARSESDGTQRALKVLTDTRGFDDARFELEHAVLRSLQHPGLINVYEKGRYGQIHYYAMDYCPGPTLKEQAGKRSYSPRQAALLVVKLADAAGHVHRHGVVHRDLKPANVILAPGGPRITDFGLARAPDLASSLTLSGEMVGTPLYMSPEQWEGGKPATARADVYALGVILYECMVGRPPFKGRTVVELAPKVLSGKLFPPSDYVELPADLEAVCLKALALDPAERYADGAELAAALRHCLGQPDPQAPKSPRRVLGVLAAIAVPALLTSAYAAWLLAGDARPAPTAIAEAPLAAPEPTPAEPAPSAEALHRRALELAHGGADLAPVLAAFAAAQDAPDADRSQLHLERLALLVRRRQRDAALREASSGPALDRDSPLGAAARWFEAQALLLPAGRPLTRLEGERLVALLEGLQRDANWGPVANAQLMTVGGAGASVVAQAYAALEAAAPWGEAEHARRVLLGSFCNSSRRYDEAERLLREAVTGHPDDTEALTLLAFVLRNRHRDTSEGNLEAAELYARVVRLSEPNPPDQVLLYRARLLCELEDFAAAAECARRRLQLGDDLRASFWLGVACLELGQRDEARRAIRAAFAQGEDAVGMELQILNAKLPGRSTALYRLLKD